MTMDGKCVRIINTMYYHKKPYDDIDFLLKNEYIIQVKIETNSFFKYNTCTFELTEWVKNIYNYKYYNNE